MRTPKVEYRRPKFQVKGTDLVLLTAMLIIHHREHGETDAYRTSAELFTHLAPKLPYVWVTQVQLESLLYAANMSDEESKFWSPLGLTFDSLLARLKLRGWKFNKKYNYLEHNELEYKWSRKFQKKQATKD